MMVDQEAEVLNVLNVALFLILIGEERSEDLAGEGGGSLGGNLGPKRALEPFRCGSWDQLCLSLLLVTQLLGAQRLNCTGDTSLVSLVLEKERWEQSQGNNWL